MKITELLQQMEPIKEFRGETFELRICSDFSGGIYNEDGFMLTCWEDRDDMIKELNSLKEMIYKKIEWEL